MSKLDEVLQMWASDSVIDRTEPGKALIDIPKLHSKYLNILSSHRLLAKEAEFQYNKWRKLKWEYYTGRLDEDELKSRGWEVFPFTLKSEINTYLEADEDVNKYLARKLLHEEIVEVCQAIIKELNARTFQLRDYISWEKFIQGV
jgi:hypothetical protein